MAVFNGAFPILPGKIDAARAFASDVAGGRKAEFKDMQKRSGTTRETWSLQETPAGAFMLVWFEGNIDKNTNPGPRIKIYNASSVLADATIDATPRGV